jgi:shikimate kinase
MEWMNEHGITVWINESIEILMNRLRNEKEERPLIKDVDNNELEAFIVDKLKERKVFYLQANYIFNGKDLANDVLLNILKNVKL